MSTMQESDKQEVAEDTTYTTQRLSEEELKAFLVEFGPQDRDNPKNWSRSKRWYMTIVASLIAFNAGVASSAPAGIASNLALQFAMSEELVVLCISLFVTGYCVGPVLWGPLSEQYGRRLVFLSTLPVYTCFQVGCALAHNRTSIIVLRLLAGIFAAAPFTNSGAIISDMCVIRTSLSNIICMPHLCSWDASTRGKANILFANAPFIGSALGPLVGGYISVSGISWRWTFWVLTIFVSLMREMFRMNEHIVQNGLCITLVVTSLPETYPPILLLRKARQKRVQTGDHRYYAPMETYHLVAFSDRLKQTLLRPFKMLFQEPMLAATTVYTSFIYGTMYMVFEAFPSVYQGEHGFNPGTLGLTYLPVVSGCVTASFVYLLVFNPRYEAAVQRYKPNHVPPEVRLEMAMWTSPLYAIAFFWFGWTSFPHITVWGPLSGAFFLGFSSILLFLSLINYIVDVYLFAAASALAANTVVRSAAAGGLPLFAPRMYSALDPRWASTILGCVALLMMPIPFVLYKYGTTLRAKSKFAPTIHR
ncbi:hypothetical protein CERSUDRAFT_115253 [Gelatoporia subvermispora B]|uniref:Major facilitator superfamily (MFS) profile domain-containing protein n=1 Tax=Ceriporiopsis subvermispora (strain B) TaxID=914234 RepID=M2QH05_CERS8|nr:hypothetical protein CERSUDRAFT_115253 [Gelatoporia subvermispora B]